MAGKAEAVYLDDLGNVVPREQARRVRITLMGGDGKPVREVWGAVYQPDNPGQWAAWELEYDAGR
jgi:hypothetical protein